MRHISSPLAAIATAAFLFAGCSDNPTEPESGSLTQEEAIAVFSEIMSAVFVAGAGPAVSISPVAGGGFTASLAPLPASAVNLDLTIDESVPCENGGVISLGGNLEVDLDDNETGTYVYNFVQTPDDCVVVTESGPSYEVNGNPNIQMSGSFGVVEGEPSGVFEMAFFGGMRWSAVNGGANGSCTIDVDYALNWDTMTGSAVGKICGYDVDEEF